MIVICPTVFLFCSTAFLYKQNFHVVSINASQFVTKNYSNAQFMLKVEEFVVFCPHRRPRPDVPPCLPWRSSGSHGEDHPLGGAPPGYQGYATSVQTSQNHPAGGQGDKPRIEKINIF